MGYTTLDPPTAAEEAALLKRSQNWDPEALEELVLRNVRIVHQQINKLFRSDSLRSGEREDLVQEGLIAVCRAVSRFKPKNGRRLSSFMVPCIRNQLLSAKKDQANIIRVPKSCHDHIVRLGGLREASARIREAEHAGEDVLALGRYRVTAKTVQDAVRALQRLESLDRQVSSSSRYRTPTLGASIEDTRLTGVEIVEDKDAARWAAKTLRRVIKKLPERIRFVIEFRYGLAGNAEHTLEEVSKKIGLSRERARQLQFEGLKLLGEKFERLLRRSKISPEVLL